MGWALMEITPPAEEPITLAEARAQCRIDVDDEDDTLSLYIAAAREQVEAETRRAGITRTLELRLDEWPEGDEIRLPRPPLQSVVSISYETADGTTETLDTSAYVVDTASTPGRVVLADGESWPSDDLAPAGAVRVRYVAGYGDTASDLPAWMRQAVRLLVGHWYENREATVSVGNVRDLPFGVVRLLRARRVPPVDPAGGSG